MVIHQWRETIKILIALIVFFTIFSLFSLFSYAATEVGIDSNVKLSLCGDGIVEGSEDCEPQYQEIFQCSDIGSYTGTTTCDIACEYDMLTCVPVIPLEPPTPPEEGNNETPPVVSVNPFLPVQNPALRLPIIMRLFDLDRDGLIVNDEFVNFIKTWVRVWNEYIYERIDNSDSSYSLCDINNDNRCNLVDLSISLYYSE
ncbi:hypothetical protein HYV12_02810 [Candidatus Dojkabacteria bacterium]|nr:hypothetical protein [Candidatus Dojkabacteria bacterium]